MNRLSKIAMLACLAMGFVLAWSVPAAAVQCGDIIKEDTVLTEDLYCPDSYYGVQLAADNITLNCADHFITGNGFANSTGIYVGAWGKNRIITNCNVSGFYTGIHLPQTSGAIEILKSKIYDNTLRGIFVQGALANSETSPYSVVIRDNEIINNRIYGILIDNGTNSGLIENNVITGHPYDILLGNSSDWWIIGNKLKTAIVAAGGWKATWNRERADGGGNFWIGFSETCVPDEAGKFCRDPKIIDAYNRDLHPLLEFGPPINTPAGENVVVDLGFGKTVIFEKVLEPGFTTLKQVDPLDPPEGFVFADDFLSGKLADITSTAILAPDSAQTFIFKFGDTIVDDRYRMMAYVDGKWQDITSDADHAGNEILGTKIAGWCIIATMLMHDVEGATAGLALEVESYGLPHDDSYLKMTDAIKASLLGTTFHDWNTADNQLDSFKFHVSAQSGKQLTIDQAHVLITQAGAIQSSIGAILDVDCAPGWSLCLGSGVCVQDTNNCSQAITTCALGQYYCHDEDPALSTCTHAPEICEVQCEAGSFRCPNGNCVTDLNFCLDANCALGEYFCRDADPSTPDFCADSLEICDVQCEAGWELCANNGTCVNDVNLCSSASCFLGGYFCHDADPNTIDFCADSADYCNVQCDPGWTWCYGRGTCVMDLIDCTFPPVQCGVGEYVCSNQGYFCSETSDICEVTCDLGYTMCPDSGACVSDISLCSTANCDAGDYFCYDADPSTPDFCAASRFYCNVECASGFSVCPQDGVCMDNNSSTCGFPNPCGIYDHLIYDANNQPLCIPPCASGYGLCTNPFVCVPWGSCLLHYYECADGEYYCANNPVGEKCQPSAADCL